MLNNDHRAPLTVLQQLCEVKHQGSNMRPFAKLVADMDNFLPIPCTKAAGLEIGTISYLAPFFKFSLMYEDDTKLASRFFNPEIPAEGLVIKTLQDELQNSRVRQTRRILA